MDKLELRNVPQIVAAGLVDINDNKYMKATVLKDNEGHTYINMSDLIDRLCRVYNIQRNFAKSQCMDMAPQASWDAGKARGMEDLIGNIELVAKQANEMREEQ